MTKYHTIQNILKAYIRIAILRATRGIYKSDFGKLIKGQYRLCPYEECADTDFDCNLLIAKICTVLKKFVRFQRGRPRRNFEKLYAEREKVQDILEEKLDAIECEIGNVEEQWHTIKKGVLDIL